MKGSNLSRVILIGLIALALCVFFTGDKYNRADETQYTFTQSEWSGGESGENASHPTNQTAWNEYSSKET